MSSLCAPGEPGVALKGWWRVKLSAVGASSTRMAGKTAITGGRGSQVCVSRGCKWSGWRLLADRPEFQAVLSGKNEWEALRAMLAHSAKEAVAHRVSLKGAFDSVWTPGSYRTFLCWYVCLLMRALGVASFVF